MDEGKLFETCPKCNGVKQTSSPSNSTATDRCARCYDNGKILTDEGKRIWGLLKKLETIGKAQDEIEASEKRAKEEEEKRSRRGY